MMRTFFFIAILSLYVPIKSIYANGHCSDVNPYLPPCLDNFNTQLTEEWLKLLDPNYQEIKDENLILGSTLSWSNKISVVRDVQISNLRIRQVRLKDNDCQYGYRDVLELDGMINKDTVLILDKLLDEIKEICHYSVQVTLNSGGGYIINGIEVGRIFRKYGVQTLLMEGQKCQSSCSTAFFGGLYRLMQNNSELMMHAPYINTGYFSISCSSEVEANELKVFYIDMLGVEIGNLLFERTMSYCSTNDGWTLNKDAAELIGLLR